MQITIIQVGTPETIPGAGGRPYKKLEVLYRNDAGEAQTKKLVSFKNPTVFKTLAAAQPNQVYEVESVKDEQGKYWEWKSANLVSAQQAQPTGELPQVDKNGGAAKSAVKLAFTETDRQRLIVRQSSLKGAVDLASATAEVGKGFNLDVILQIAEKFEAWVCRNEEVVVATPVQVVVHRAAQPTTETTSTEVRRPGRPRKVVPVEQINDELNEVEVE